MLLLTRYVGESVDLIDRDTRRVIATVSVLALLPNDNVRLGFNAGPEISIVRDNAKRRMESEQESNDQEDDDSRGNR